MHIQGAGNLTPQQVAEEVAGGARLVFFEYCISCIILTLRCPTSVHLLRPGEFGLVRGLPYTLLSLTLGWWGVPMGILYTPLVVLTNLTGGCDVTDELLPQLLREGTESDPPRDPV